MIYDLSNEESKKRLLSYIEELSKIGGKYDVEINTYSGTEKELRKVYFSTIVKPLADYTGNDRIDIHNHLKAFCNPEFEFFEITKMGSTKNISKNDWVNYIARCQAYIAEFFLDKEKTFKVENDL